MKHNCEHMPLHMILGQLLHLSKNGAGYLLESMQLNSGQAGVLFVLNAHGKLSQRELAEMTRVKPPSMTVALRKIEELGYIKKEPDEKDQRIIRIDLTEKGREGVCKISKVIREMEEIMYRGITEEEQLLLRRLLFKMQENLCKTREFIETDFQSFVHQQHN